VLTLGWAAAEDVSSAAVRFPPRRRAHRKPAARGGRPPWPDSHGRPGLRGQLPAARAGHGPRQEPGPTEDLPRRLDEATAGATAAKNLC